MATKTELIAQLEALLREGEPETKADDVEALKTSYEALIAAAESERAATVRALSFFLSFFFFFFSLALSLPPPSLH